MATATAAEDVSMGIRITKDQRASLDAIAERQCNTVGGVIRLAINQMIEQEAEAVKEIKRRRKLG